MGYRQYVQYVRYVLEKRVSVQLSWSCVCVCCVTVPYVPFLFGLPHYGMDVWTFGHLDGGCGFCTYMTPFAFFPDIGFLFFDALITLFSHLSSPHPHRIFISTPPPPSLPPNHSHTLPYLTFHLISTKVPYCSAVLA